MGTELQKCQNIIDPIGSSPWLETRRSGLIGEVSLAQEATPLEAHGRARRNSASWLVRGSDPSAASLRRRRRERCTHRDGCEVLGVDDDGNGELGQRRSGVRG